MSAKTVGADGPISEAETRSVLTPGVYADPVLADTVNHRRLRRDHQGYAAVPDGVAGVTEMTRAEIEPDQKRFFNAGSDG